MPVQRPIPVWIGGSSPPAYRRMGRLADGWFPQVPPGPRLDEARSIIEQAAVEAGRDPGSLGLEGRVSWTAGGGLDKLVDHVGRWRATRATHLSVNTIGAGFGSVDEHIAALASVAASLELSAAR